MSAPDDDRSWTIAPVIVWFVAVLVVAVWRLDGNLNAFANRLTVHRETTAAPSVAAQSRVAQADDDRDDLDVVPPAAPATTGGGGSIGALEDTCLDGTPTTCKRWAMDGFYRAIADEQAGKLARAVRVSWYGDSVVATDALPSRLRTRLQTELGDGGPGFVYVVPPHRFCHHEQISRAQAGTWRVHAISTTQVADGLYGPAGSTAQAEGGATATLRVSSAKVHKVELYYLAQPERGEVDVLADGSEVLRTATTADARAPAWATATIDSGAQKFEVETKGHVRLFGVQLENAKGAVVDNLGIVSANVKSFAANDAAHWQAELAHRDADLLMIMIGANEAEWLQPGDKDTKDYQSHYEAALAPLRKGRPDAACLVVSPTDQAEADGDGYRSRPVMPVLVDAQRKAARAQGCAFYSTYDWMGGKGSAEKWFKHGLVSSDFQHLSHKGANKMADAVFDALMAGSKRYAKK